MEQLLEELKKKRIPKSARELLKLGRYGSINHRREENAKMAESEIKKFPWELMKKHLEHSPDALRLYEEVCKRIRYEIRHAPYLSRPAEGPRLYAKFYYEQLPPTFVEWTLSKCIKGKSVLRSSLLLPVTCAFALGAAVAVAVSR